MAEQLKLPRELARELADIIAPCATFTDDDPDSGWTPKAHCITGVVENRHTGQEKRWTSIHELVIQTKDGRLWRRLYEQGLTEYQDTEPFEYEGDVIPFDEVKRVRVEHYEYQPV